MSGVSVLGGIFGFSYCNGYSSNFMTYVSVSQCNITGTSSWIGGVVGDARRGVDKFISVTNTNITGTTNNSIDIGGIYGQGNKQLYYFQVDKVMVKSVGKNIGGVIGASNGESPVAPQSGYVYNSVVEGNSCVGGVVGFYSSGYIFDIYVNAQIKANSNIAGGLVGYMDNTNMTGANYVTCIYRNIVANSSVEAPTKAGGIIGDIAKEIYRDQSFYYNNFVDADVTSTNNSTGSLIIGGRPDENPYIQNTYVYKYSTLNENYVYSTNDNIESNKYLIRDDLNNVSTLRDRVGLGTISWNYTSLSNGKYPEIASSYLYKPELQTGVDLPIDPEITELNSLSVGDETSDIDTSETKPNTNNTEDKNGITTQSIESLPSYKVYPTKVDEINIDFGNIPEGVSFTYSINGENEESESIELMQKTYTFKYNYRYTLEIKLTNGKDEETITIKPEDVRSNASLVGNNNAYLLGTNLYINGELHTGEYVNIYEGYALNSSGQVVDIATKEIVEGAGGTDEVATKEAVTTALEETTKPLYMYNYKGSDIEVYGIYSTVNGNVKLQIYNVRNGQLSAIANNVDMKIGNSIIDNYNDKEYQTVLTTSGELIDLKDKLQYPANFLSGNIKQVVQNTNAEVPEMMVLYNTGKVIVFNYVTGQVIYENNEKADSGLANYLARSFSNIWSDYEERWQEYTKSKELETKLAKLPIEEAIRGNSKNETETSSATNTIVNNSDNILTSVEKDTNLTVNSDVSNTTADNSYITVYNADTGEYEVYSEDEILNGDDDNPVSETEKIKQNGLEGVYGYSANEEVKPQANGAIIVISIIAVAVIALVILRKVIVKNSRKEKNK